MVAQSERARADRQRRSRAAGAADRRGRAVDRAAGAHRCGDVVADRHAGGPLVLALEPLLAQARGEVTWGEFDETAPCGLCFTSGTTGAPKGVTYTHRSSYLHTLRLLQADVMAISARDCVLAVVPMFHANAWGLPFAAPAAGAKLVLPGRHTDGASLAALINAEAVTVGVGVATVWLDLVEHLETHRRRGADAGARHRRWRAAAAGARWSASSSRLGVTVQTSWGMTELSPSGTVAPPDAASRSAHCRAVPPIGVDLLLTDADGRALPRAARRGGASARARRRGDRALFRR